MTKKIIFILTLALFISGCKNQYKQWYIKNYGEKVNGIKGKRGFDISLPDRKTLQLCKAEKNKIVIVDADITSDVELLKNVDIIKISNENNWADTTHATGIAGIITSANNTGDYVSVLSNAQLLSIVINPSNLDEERLIQDLKTAEQMGAKVVNCSFVMTEYSKKLYEFMAKSKLLFICAVGNDNKDEIMYPAAYKLDNVISVIGVNNYGYCSRYSNYSLKADIAAPGENILCIDKNGKFNYVSGSSYAVPFVTATCTYIIDRKNCSAKEAKEFLLQSAVHVSSLEGKVKDAAFLHIAPIT